MQQNELRCLAEGLLFIGLSNERLQRVITWMQQFSSFEVLWRLQRRRIEVFHDLMLHSLGYFSVPTAIKSLLSIVHSGVILFNQLACLCLQPVL